MIVITDHYNYTLLLGIMFCTKHVMLLGSAT